AFPSTTAYVTRDEGIPGLAVLAEVEAPSAPAEAGPTEPSGTTTTSGVDEDLEVDPSQTDEDEH
ncbi:MAG: hypothetical protein AB1Z66_01645, partial [Candidatus Limnocylindrales bacterium]